MEILYIILGWLLGILSPSIVKKISEKYEKENLEKIIFNDLRDLKKRLAPLSYSILSKYGKLDEEKFKWLEKNSGIDFSTGIQEMLKKGNDIKSILENLNKIGIQKNTLTYFKKMHLFAVDSHLINLNLVDSFLMTNVLEIRFYVEAFNEDVDNFREHLKMTFQPGITDINHKIISQELDNLSLNISQKSMFIVDKINTILEK